MFLKFFLFSERVVERHLGYTRLYWTGSHIITRLEAWDQSDGLGGQVYHVENGAGHSSVVLHIASVWESTEIDFIVRIYAEIEISPDTRLYTEN